VSDADIVDVQISVTSAGPTRPGFGTGLIAACRVRWGVTADRVRSYTDLPAMVADGFIAADPAYQMAAAMFSQEPRPERVKVGLRSLPCTQVIELTPSAPAAGEEYSVTVNGAVATYTADGTPTVAEVCTGLATAITAAGAADVDAIIATGASTAGTQTLTGTSLDGVIGGRLMAQPRALALVLSSHADWNATTITVTGKDGAGRTITEDFAVPDNGNATVSGSKLFARITQVSIPAQAGTGGTFTLGVRTRVTADGSSTTKIVCTATTAGELVDYSGLSSNLSLFNATTDPGIATDLAALRLADSDWYGLVLDSNSKAESLAAAAWAEPLKVLFVAQTADTASKSSGSTTDLLYLLKDAAYTHAPGFYHPAVATATSWFAAGAMGDRFPDDPGSDTWAFKTIAGVAAYALTDTEQSAILAKNGTVYVSVAGVPATQGGKVPSGEWIDVIRFLDWLRVNMRLDIIALLLANKKIPYTAKGIDLVVGAVRGRLNAGSTDGGTGGIDAEQPIRVTAPKLAAISATDKRNRLLPNVQFSCVLAGAIHAVQVRGSVTE